MKPIAFDFSGKVAIVTGASRGIGEAIATGLANCGAHVILTSRKIDGLKQVEEKIAADGGKATAVACHTGKMADIDNLFKFVEDQTGRLDYLVNNAATNPYFGENINAEEAAWEKTVGVNLKGCFFMTQKAAKMMMKVGGGAVVNVASVNAIRPAPYQGIYSVTKAGLVAMTQSFAKELATKNIRVNALLPGFTETKFSAVMTSNDEIRSMILQQVPVGRMGQPEDMVGAVLYLLSDLAAYTTGSRLVVDGGMLA